MEKSTTTIALKKVGASFAFFVISWQLDPSPLKTKIKMKGEETRHIYTMDIFFISQSELKLLTKVNWYVVAVLEL